MRSDKSVADTPKTPITPPNDSVSEPPTLTMRIGKTTYKVTVNFSKTSRETMARKIARLIEAEVLRPSEVTDTALNTNPDEIAVPRPVTDGKENPP